MQRTVRCDATGVVGLWQEWHPITADARLPIPVLGYEAHTWMERPLRHAATAATALLLGAGVAAARGSVSKVSTLRLLLRLLLLLILLAPARLAWMLQRSQPPVSRSLLPPLLLPAASPFQTPLLNPRLPALGAFLTAS